MRKTKEQVLKENTQLEQRVSSLEARERHLRDQFSKVLGDPRQSIHDYVMRSDVTLTWEQIFFIIGELNSDANYTILLGEKHRLEKDNEVLRNKLDGKKPITTGIM